MKQAQMCADGCKGCCLQVSFENLEKPEIAFVNIFLNVRVEMDV
jgi:hypothetical protein